jgi:hypothetical protein
MNVTTETITPQDIGVVHVSGGALADANLITPPPFGLGGYEITDFRLPVMGIANQTEQQVDYDCKPGEYFIDITKEHFKEFEAIVLHIQLGQWWGDDYDVIKEKKLRGEEVKAFCKSSDGKRPDTDVEHPQAQFCRKCPRAKAQKNDTGGYTAPQCANSRQLLLKLRDGILARYVTRKTGCKPVDSFANPFFMRGKEPMSTWTRFSTQMQKNSMNTWFTPALSAIDDKVSKEELAELKETVTAYLPMLQRIDEDIAHGTDAADEDGPRQPGATTRSDGYTAGPTLDAAASHVTTAPVAAGPANTPPPQAEIDLDDPDLDI